MFRHLLSYVSQILSFWCTELLYSISFLLSVTTVLVADMPPVAAVLAADMPPVVLVAGMPPVDTCPYCRDANMETIIVAEIPEIYKSINLRQHNIWKLKYIDFSWVWTLESCDIARETRYLMVRNTPNPKGGTLLILIFFQPAQNN